MARDSATLCITFPAETAMATIRDLCDTALTESKLNPQVTYLLSLVIDCRLRLHVLQQCVQQKILSQWLKQSEECAMIRRQNPSCLNLLRQSSVPLSSY